MSRDMKVALRQRSERQHPWTRCHLALPYKLALELDMIHGRGVSRSVLRATARVSLIALGQCLRLPARAWSGRYAVFSSVATPVCGSP
jgi:hypothetical protein